MWEETQEMEFEEDMEGDLASTVGVELIIEVEVMD